MEPDDCIITVIIVKRRDETGVCVWNRAAQRMSILKRHLGNAGSVRLTIATAL